MKIRGRKKESLSLPRLPWLSVWAEVEHTIRMCRLGLIDPGCAGEHVHLHHSRQDCYLGCNASLKILPLSNNGHINPCSNLIVILEQSSSLRVSLLNLIVFISEMGVVLPAV